MVACYWSPRASPRYCSNSLAGATLSPLFGGNDIIFELGGLQKSNVLRKVSLLEATNSSMNSSKVIADYHAHVLNINNLETDVWLGGITEEN